MNTNADKDRRSAADELKDELREAEAELRAAGLELGEELRIAGIEIGKEGVEISDELKGVATETRRAIRRAMAEARRAMRGPAETPDTARPGGGRMSRAERKQLTRELLLDAAGEVFAAKGYHGASLEDVADAAGFTKGAVYSNFSTKAELFIALAERRMDERKTAMLAAIQSMSVDDLPGLARETIDGDGRRGEWDLLMLEFALAAVRDPELREVFTRWQRDVGDEIGGALERKLRGAGLNPAFSGRELMLLLDGISSGLVISSLIDPSIDVGDLLERASRHLADGPRQSGGSAQRSG